MEDKEGDEIMGDKEGIRQTINLVGVDDASTIFGCEHDDDFGKGDRTEL